MLLLCTEYAPMLLYIGFLVREGSWNSAGANTSNKTAISVQKTVLCLLKHLNDRDTLLPYERTIGAHSCTRLRGTRACPAMHGLRNSGRLCFHSWPPGG